jgi:hypothetical protein
VIISVHFTNQLLFVKMAQCVFCAVVNKVSNIVSKNDCSLYQINEFDLSENLYSQKSVCLLRKLQCISLPRPLWLSFDATEGSVCPNQNSNQLSFNESKNN